MLYRMGQPYFDRKLNVHNIGAGQHFFLLRINEKPGISMQELAQKGHYDKGTANRAVKKLEEEGYVICELDEKDRRIRRVRVTQKAVPIIEDTNIALKQWCSIMQGSLTEEELERTEKTLEKMAENVYHYMKKNKEKE